VAFGLGSRRYVFGVLDQKRVEWVVEAKRRGVDIADALGAAALFSLWWCGRGPMLKKPGRQRSSKITEVGRVIVGDAYVKFMVCACFYDCS